MNDPEFAQKQLAMIRRTFFAKTSEKQFFQERNLLLSAIAFPTAHLKERYGINTPDSLAATILHTVIQIIIEKGRRSKIQRFSVYFLHCVQEQMKHHGEEHYETAKAALRAAESLPEIMRQVRIGEIDRSTEMMVALHRTLKSKGGRKRKSGETQLNLI